MKMVDMGTKRDNNIPDNNIPALSPTDKNRIDYPSIYMLTDKLPELKKTTLDDTVVLCIKCKATSLRETKEGGKDTVKIDFNILEAGIMDKSTKPEEKKTDLRHLGKGAEEFLADK